MGSAVEEVWRTREMRNHFNNPVHAESVLVGFDNAMLTAIDVETGQRLWREHGFGKGSLVLH
jgi:outer membrane protein assembly factor BamB